MTGQGAPWTSAVDDLPTGGRLITRTEPDQTRINLGGLRQDYASLRDETRLLHLDTATGHHRIRRSELTQRAGDHARGAVPNILRDIYERGFSWTDIARCLGVSVPALRKWRNGESITPANRTRAARFLALCEYLERNVPVLADVAGWFETPLVPEANLTPMDLYIAGREDLVLDYAEQPEANPHSIMDRHDPSWRERISDFEVIVGEDGVPSIQHRP